uniref:Uncharacterized protein n=1 Tax=Pseudomonas phage HRDY3 TaxID=3236930 RepID=A0AB39CDQ1_9VIRU
MTEVAENNEVPNFNGYEGDILAWTDMLRDKHGWSTEMFNNVLPEFVTFVDFDHLLIIHNNPKAYYTRETLQKISDMIDTYQTGRWLFSWAEVHDDAHRFVRDGEEYEGSDMYGTVGYTMDLTVRPLATDEEIPVKGKENV